MQFWLLICIITIYVVHAIISYSCLESVDYSPENKVIATETNDS
jgi:hypothetical protein